MVRKTIMWEALNEVLQQLPNIDSSSHVVWYHLASDIAAIFHLHRVHLILLGVALCIRTLPYSAKIVYIIIAL